MALTRLPSFAVLSTDSFTFANVTLTSNVTANNASLGNAVTANYFIGSGNNLSNIQVANISGLGNLATVDKDGNSSNILYGNGVFASAPVTYGDSNVASLLSSFGSNTITTTGDISVGNISANGITTSGSGGNISGANWVLANYFSGSGNNLSNIQLANVSGLGNIATINKDGNSSNILYGNGVFASAPVTYGNSNVVTLLASLGSNSITTTGNVSVGNIIGNGQALTGLTGANVTGQVPNANVSYAVYNNAQPNITSVGILSSLEVSGNTVIGGNLIVNGTTTTINSTVVQIDDLALVLANDASTSSQANGAGVIINGASANMLYINSTNSFTFSHKISADGSLLSNVVAASANSVAGSNVSGEVSYAVTANSVAVANVTGIGNIATLNLDGNSSNILYGNGVFASAPVTYGNSNVEAFLPTYTGNLSPGNLSISVDDLQITGGTANYVLRTDGAGNLSWVAQASGGGGSPSSGALLITTDVFTANGVSNSYTLTTTPVSEDYILVNIDGVTQLHSSYTLTDDVVLLDGVPANGAIVEIVTYGGSGPVSGANTQVQFNDDGILSSSANLTFDKTTNTLNATVVTANGAPVATTGKAIAMAIVFGF